MKLMVFAFFILAVISCNKNATSPTDNYNLQDPKDSSFFIGTWKAYFGPPYGYLTFFDDGTFTQKKYVTDTNGIITDSIITTGKNDSFNYDGVRLYMKYMEPYSRSGPTYERIGEYNFEPVFAGDSLYLYYIGIYSGNTTVLQGTWSATIKYYRYDQSSSSYISAVSEKHFTDSTMVENLYIADTLNHSDTFNINILSEYIMTQLSSTYSHEQHYFIRNNKLYIRGYEEDHIILNK